MVDWSLSIRSSPAQAGGQSDGGDRMRRGAPAGAPPTGVERWRLWAPACAGEEQVA